MIFTKISNLKKIFIFNKYYNEFFMFLLLHRLYETVRIFGILPRYEQFCFVLFKITHKEWPKRLEKSYQPRIKTKPENHRPVDRSNVPFKL